MVREEYLPLTALYAIGVDGAKRGEVVILISSAKVDFDAACTKLRLSNEIVDAWVLYRPPPLRNL